MDALQSIASGARSTWMPCENIASGAKIWLEVILPDFIRALYAYGHCNITGM